MSKLTPTRDSRTTYDKKTGAVRSFFGAGLVKPLPKAKRGLAAAARGDHFLAANRDLFRLDRVTLGKGRADEGAASESVTYSQEHHGVPVYGAQLVVGSRKPDGAVTSAVNTLQYEIPADLTPERAVLDGPQAVEAARKRLASRFKSLDVGPPTQYIYRHVVDESLDLGEPQPAGRREILQLSTGSPGRVYVVWHMTMTTHGPAGSWELFVNAANGALVSVRDARRYADPKADIFWPDPIRSKQDDSLSWSTSESELNKQLVKDVNLENLDPPSGGKYKLDGKWVLSRDRDKPDYAPPDTAADFKYSAKSKDFLSVMAYYYLDRLIVCLRDYGIASFNNAVTGPIEVDAQGVDEDNNSFFDPNASPAYIAYGTNEKDPSTGTPLVGVPDAQDPGVVVHEYGHAIHYFLKREQLYHHEHWFCDFLAVAWVDRYNKHQYVRAEMFPWDNNTGDEWSTVRRVDLTQRFDDSGYASYKSVLQGAIGATALWDWFLNIGGDSPDANTRRQAADEAIRTYMEMLLLVSSNTTAENLAKGLITADANRTGGLYKKVIWDAFRRRGLWNDFTPLGNVDLYIRDSDTDTGEHASPQVHWTSPDIWVRNNDISAASENPDDGHEPPINNIPNYLYVRVTNRGSQDAAANSFTVEAFHCDPATAMIWPTHFTSMGKLLIAAGVPANGGSVRVGPFVWTPQIMDHECLVAIVRGVADPTIADDVATKAPVDHWKLVRFDNNVGQRNVAPGMSTPGGKTKTSFLMRGSTHPSTNSLRLDASAMPPDTKIAVRVAAAIVDGAGSLTGLTVRSRNDRWCTLSLAGGAVGEIGGFPLATSEEKSVGLEIDFSYKAEHLKRYPIVVGQVQDGVLAGQLTIEITAVREAEDYFYGNVRTREVHTFSCGFRQKMRPRNQVPFQTVELALARGYNGCRYCLPDYSTD